MTDRFVPPQVVRQSAHTHTPAADNAAVGSAPGVAATKGPSARSRRRHPAKGARIAATGLSFTAMLGIVAGLGAQSPLVSVAAEAGPPAVIPVGVVTVDPQTAAPTEVTVSELSGQPVQLTATPVVRAAQPAPAAPAPVAQTNGSR